MLPTTQLSASDCLRNATVSTRFPLIHYLKGKCVCVCACVCVNKHDLNCDYLKDKDIVGFARFSLLLIVTFNGNTSFRNFVPNLYDFFYL